MPKSIVGSVGDFDSKLTPKHGPLKRFIVDAKGVVKTVLRFEAKVKIQRDEQGEIDWTKTFKLVTKKLFAEGSGIPNLSLILEHTKLKGKIFLNGIADDVITVVLPMWLADP